MSKNRPTEFFEKLPKITIDYFKFDNGHLNLRLSKVIIRLQFFKYYYY